MATGNPDGFRRRARRAYELGRLRHSAIKAWPALALTTASIWLCHEAVLSLEVGAALVVLAGGLFWYGGVTARAAATGLWVGMAAFSAPVIAFDVWPAPHCCSAPSVLVVNGACGLAVGIWLSIRSQHLRSQKNLFLLLAGLVAALCGMLGCILFGPIGLAGMAAGVLLPIGPLTVYRRATA